MSEIDLCKGDCLEVGKEIFTIEDEEHYYCVYFF